MEHKFNLEKIDNFKVTKSNALISAAQGLSKAEALLVNMAISQINPLECIKYNDKCFVIDVNDYSKATNTPISSARKQLSKAKDDLYERSMHFPQSEIKAKDFECRKVRWLQECATFENGAIRIMFTNTALNLLCDFNKERSRIADTDSLSYCLDKSKGFTSYPLTDILQLKSVYSIYLYEYSVQILGKQSGIYRNQYPECVNINQLKLLFNMLNDDGVETKQTFKRNWHVIDRVLKPAIEEVNKKTLINIEIEERWSGKSDSSQRGKSISEVLFKVSKKKSNGELFTDYDKAVDDLSKIKSSYQILKEANEEHALILKPKLDEAKKFVENIKNEFTSRGLKLPDTETLTEQQAVEAMGYYSDTLDVSAEYCGGCDRPMSDNESGMYCASCS